MSTRAVKRKQLYSNLDAIISVGYRIKSVRATQFRIWATQHLKGYLIQGSAINKKRISKRWKLVNVLRDEIALRKGSLLNIFDRMKKKLNYIPKTLIFALLWEQFK